MEYNKIGKIIKALEKATKDWVAAVKDKDIDLADSKQNEADRLYKDYKSEQKYIKETMSSNAGMLGHVFEEQLPDLFIRNRKAIGEITRLIKEDKNLKSQLQFFDALKKYDGSMDAKDYIKESVSIAKKNIDKFELSSSNHKLAKLFLKYDIHADDSINEDKANYFRAGTYMLTHDRKLNNLSDIGKKEKIVENYIVEHKHTDKGNEKDIKKITENFDKSMSMLNEDEKTLVQDIINSKSTVAEKRQKLFFNDLKDKCIDKINKILVDASDDEKPSIESVKNEISEMEYNKESIIKDTAKLLEIGAVLSDNDNKKYF